jgi:hypothetical protein
MVGNDLIGHQPKQAQPRGRDIRTPGTQPAVKLPANPLGDVAGAQTAFVTPQPGEMLTMLGLGLDGKPGTTQTEPRQSAMQFVSHGFGGEGGLIHPLCGRIQFGGNAQLGRREPGRQRPFIQTSGQTLGLLPLRAESGQHRRSGKLGQVTEGV